MSQAKPTTWKRSSGFVWSMLGSAIGFANILSFSSQAYHNGGGAFLIPFIAAMLFLGLPMLLLEGLIGHRMRLPIASAYRQIAGRVGKLFGWLSVAAVATIGAFYTVLTGFSIAYAYFAGSGSIPTDTATFFKQSFLKDTGHLTQFGALSLPVFVSTALVCLFCWLVLARNIRSGVEKLCSLFLPVLCVIIGFFAIITCFLPGALEGIQFYLTPQAGRLLDPVLWRDVFGQVFFSFSLGLGIVTAYSRHTGETTSIPRAMWYVAMGDLIVSVIAGFAIFGCIGYLSHTSGVPLSQIVSSDNSFEMGFVIFPKILQTFGPLLSRVIGVVFFFCVFIAGVTGVFSIMESVMGNIEVEFRRSRRFAAALTSLILLGGATFFCFGNGQALIGSLAPMLMGTNMLIGGLAEIVVFMYLAKELRDDPMWRKGARHTVPYYLLRLFVPLLLTVILVASLQSEFSHAMTLRELVRWGWFGAALLLAFGLAWKKTPEEALAIQSGA